MQNKNFNKKEKIRKIKNDKMDVEFSSNIDLTQYSILKEIRNKYKEKENKPSK